MKLKSRTALVTGGSRGIGRAVALALADEGADVAVNYVSSEAAAKDVAEQIRKMGRRAMLAQADVGDFPDTFRMAQEVLKEFGRLDILVNNAGINSDKTFVKMDHASWRKVLGINLDGVFNCTKVFIDQMLKQSYGRVVNMTSVIGQIGNFGQANYAASKAGVAAFTKSLAKELAGKGVTVNAIAPGFIETEMIQGIPDKVKEKLLAQIPLKRFGTPEEVARAVVYLVSSDGDYRTGAEDRREEAGGEDAGRDGGLEGRRRRVGDVAVHGVEVADRVDEARDVLVLNGPDDLRVVAARHLSNRLPDHLGTVASRRRSTASMRSSRRSIRSSSSTSIFATAVT